jgi:multiple sugar transport system ATP-binding protein
MAEVHFENVTKRFGETIAVNSLNLKVEDKEFLVLVGPSGCGKSTILRLLSGLEEVTEGKIYIADKLVNDIPAKDRDIAMVFQSYALYPHMTVFDNMAFGLSLRKVPKPEIKRLVNQAAQILGIEDLLKRKPRQLSGGQRQRVALGRAIVREPAVFLLDEPLSNLDAKLRVQTRAELSKLHRRLGTTFIYVTHDQIEATTMADRIVVLDKGVLQQVGTPKELYDNPGNVFVAGFIGSPAMNFFDVEVKGSKEELYLDAHDFRVKVPEKKKEALLSYMDKKIIFGIRPEDIHVKEYVPTGLDASVVVRPKIDVVEMMGNELFIYLVCGNHRFMARVDPRATAHAGNDIDLVFNMMNLYAFEQESGKAIPVRNNH